MIPRKIVWWDDDGRYHLIGKMEHWTGEQMRQLNIMQDCAMEEAAMRKILDNAKQIVDEDELDNSFMRIEY